MWRCQGSIVGERLGPALSLQCMVYSVAPGCGRFDSGDYAELRPPLPDTSELPRQSESTPVWARLSATVSVGQEQAGLAGFRRSGTHRLEAASLSGYRALPGPGSIRLGTLPVGVQTAPIPKSWESRTPPG